MRDLPPIQLLFAFEAAARHLSFKKAAAELCVTASAISQQVRALEVSLNHDLFYRETRSLSLTSAGKHYCDVAAKTLTQFKQSQQEFNRHFNHNVYRVSMIPIIAYEVLIPALGEFYEVNNAIDLRIDASMNLVDFKFSNYDAVIRSGKPRGEGLYSRKLSGISITGICAPGYFSEKKPSIKRLSEKNLIHVRDRPDWTIAAQHVGLKELKVAENIYVDSYYAAAIAAEKGLGVAIGLRPFINPYLKNNRLVSVFYFDVQVTEANYFVVRAEDKSNPELNQIYKWIKSVLTEFSNTYPST